jgi:hexosaminidase
MTILGLSLSLFAQQSKPHTNVIPQPAKIKPGQGNFLLTENIPLLINGNNEDLKKSAQLFIEKIKLFGGPVLSVREMTANDKKISSISFTMAKEGKLPIEGYTLKVTGKNITLTGGSGAGLFYGTQTLFQLLPLSPGIEVDGTMKTLSTLEVPCLEITDQPRYPYRGMHLDVSRHFFPKDFIKKYIDLIAMYKMNTFQWHLTDDNGWRIEIRKYPKLTEIGAWHVDREDLPWTERPPQKPGEKATYGGFYTQDDIREIVQYAKEKYVTIIPEIEMPAHSVEVLAAYPQFSCTGGPFTVPPGSYWPNSDILCAGNDSVFQFLQDVLTEVIELFPSKYIHIGGDEADKTRWKECPKCQARIKSEGL